MSLQSSVTRWQHLICARFSGTRPAKQSSPNWLQPAPGSGLSLPGLPQSPSLQPGVWQQAWSPPGRVIPTPAHSATSRQRLGPDQILPVPRQLGNPLALAWAGSVSSTPHPNSLLMWHSWQRGGWPSAATGHLHSDALILTSWGGNSLVRDLDKSIQVCTNTMPTWWGPQVCPSDHLCSHQASFPSEEVPCHAVHIFLLHSVPPLSGAAWPWVSPASPSQKRTVPSCPLPVTTYTFLGSYSRIPLKCCVFILSPFGKNRS